MLPDNSVTVAKVDERQSEEQFVVIIHDKTKSQGNAGYFMSTSLPMAEADIKTTLSAEGISDAEIARMLQNARKVFDENRPAQADKYPATMGYANEKLWEGVHLLATHPGPLAQRLVHACNRGFLWATPAGLPEDIRREFEDVIGQLSSVRDEKEGAFAATIRTMEPEAIKECAEKLYEIAHRVDFLLRLD